MNNEIFNPFICYNCRLEYKLSHTHKEYYFILSLNSKSQKLNEAVLLQQH